MERGDLLRHFIRVRVRGYADADKAVRGLQAVFDGELASIEVECSLETVVVIKTGELAALDFIQLYDRVREFFRLCGCHDISSGTVL